MARRNVSGGIGTAKRRFSCNSDADFECRVVIDSFRRHGSGQVLRVNSTVPLFVKRSAVSIGRLARVNATAENKEKKNI